MSKHSKSVWRNWKLLLIVAVVSIVIIVGISVLVLRNKMTSEETVSRFMYLIENKQYEEAKKLCSGKLEKLDILSNIEPSNLTFDFSEDKKNATAVLLEEGIESTNLNIVINSTLLGWKIKSYEVITDLINPQIIEDRLKKGETVSNIQLLYWGESEKATKDEIKEYIDNNEMVAMIFIETMKSKNYNKAMELYSPVSTSLTVEQLKNYNWDNYKIESNFEIMDNFNSITVKLDDKKLWIYVAGKIVTAVTESTV